MRSDTVSARTTPLVPILLTMFSKLLSAHAIGQRGEDDNKKEFRRTGAVRPAVTLRYSLIHVNSMLLRRYPYVHGPGDSTAGLTALPLPTSYPGV